MDDDHRTPHKTTLRSRAADPAVPTSTRFKQIVGALPSLVQRIRPSSQPLGRTPQNKLGPMVAVDTVISVNRIFYRLASAGMKGCWRQRRASSPRAAARPFGLRGLTPTPASNRGLACDRRLDVAQQPIAVAGSKGLPVFRTPKHSTSSLRIAATTICLGLRRPRDFNRVTSATIAGL
jgi:hypothetical protein